MSNGQDNSGKPPSRPPPRVSATDPSEEVTPRPGPAPAAAPAPTNSAPAPARPPAAVVPIVTPTRAAPAAPRPPQPAPPAPQARPPAITAQPAANAPARPPSIAPPAPRAPSGMLPIAQRPAAIIPPAPPVAAARPAPLVPPAPPAVQRPPALIPPGPPAARPAAPPSAPSASPGPGRVSPLPAAGAVEAIDPQQAAALRRLAQGLSAVDYFQVLGVSQAVSPGDIKKAFYRESRTYHPDRFFHLADSQEKSDIGSIYKRITEAYYVLRDDAKRKKYLADLASADRSSKLRYTEATESELKAEARKTVEEEFGTNPKARPFFKTALAELEKGNLPAAQSALKMGLTYEPGNARFKEKLVEVQKKIEDARRGQAPSFMIK